MNSSGSLRSHYLSMSTREPQVGQGDLVIYATTVNASIPGVMCVLGEFAQSLLGMGKCVSQGSEMRKSYCPLGKLLEPN